MKIFTAKVFSVILLAACVFTPAAAQDHYTITFSNGQFYVNGRPSAAQADCQKQWREYHNASNQETAPYWTPVPQTQATTVYNADEQLQTSAPVDTDVANTYEAEVLRLTNEKRAQHGLQPLQSHGSLQLAAESHSQEMLELDYFSHQSPTPGRSGPSQRVNQAGVNPRMVAENIFQASGYDMASVAQLAVDNWMESPGHRRNILDPSATHLGVGFVAQNGTVSVTQVFAGGI